MHPKINKVQFLDPGGRSLTVRGPIADWEDDDFVAVFTVVVSQIDPDDGSVVTAIGWGTEVYRRGESTWDAAAAVADPASQLRAGGATVAAWATIASPDGGGEMYAWTLPVVLRPRAAAPTTDDT